MHHPRMLFMQLFDLQEAVVLVATIIRSIGTISWIQPVGYLDFYTKFSHFLVWYWVKQFLLECRHKYTLHFEHFQYVFPENFSFLHRVLLIAETNVGQWSDPSYGISCVTLDATFRIFFGGGSFSSSLSFSSCIELCQSSCNCWSFGFLIKILLFLIWNKIIWKIHDLLHHNYCHEYSL
jgi:hypothetical protein